MKRPLRVLIAPAVLAMSSVAGAESPEARPRLTAVPIPSPPVIDGRPDDAVWTEAPGIAWLNLIDGSRRETEPTRTSVAYDAEALYVAFSCSDSRPDTIRAACREPDGDVWHDDCVEIAIDPGATRRRTFHLIINPLGTLYDAEDGQTAWDSGATVGVARADSGWTAELVIPFASLGGVPAAGAMWGLNLCREQHRLQEVSVWSRTDAPARASGCGDLLFGGRDTPVLRLPETGHLEYGLNRVPCTVVTAEAPGPALRVRIALGAETAAHEQRLPESVPPAVYHWDSANDVRELHDMVEHKVNHFLVATGRPRLTWTSPPVD